MVLGEADVVHLRVALLFHSSVLKPNLDCTFGQSELLGKLAPARPGHVKVGVKLFFELI